jgi:hypothetical protein
MCKTEFAVEIDGEQGRIKNLRKENGVIIGTFIGRASTFQRNVPISKVTCAHAKAVKNLKTAIQALNGNGNNHPKQKKK